MFQKLRLNAYPLDFIERNLVAGAVVKLGGLRRLLAFSSGAQSSRATPLDESTLTFCAFPWTLARPVRGKNIPLVPSGAAAWLQSGQDWGVPGAGH
jgi:hypothetical protein